MADNNLNMVDVDEHITEVVHHTGTTFHVYLTSQELLRANTDPTFAEEISEKYYELYQKGLVRAIETASLPEDSGTTPNNDDNENKIRWTDHQIKFLISLTDSSQSSITMTPTTSDAEGNCDTPNHTTPEAVTPGSTRRVSRKRSRIAARLATEEPEWFKKYREDAMLRHQERMEVLNKLTNILNSLCH
ncbi:uncharacterized protein LOC108911571 [Anoplophora glabripennis]|uniref:uncharacterized protein LOC108911571 n=1 Tax=Anoplophora glabripennis TaxID=217634 RepID=UPI0008755F31|nr:uncharacterized protein LOC108911571 [Anoplophora glabripennis]